MHNNLAPICLFVYNRIDETKLTIKALQVNFLANESDLIVFSDGYKDENDAHSVRIVRDFVRNISGFRSVKIIESFNNKGLAKSVIEGVSLVLEKSENIIILEDDLITTPNFLDFMNQALSFYKDNKEVYSVNGFTLDVGWEEFVRLNDVFFHNRTYSWGWGTWSDKWCGDDFINQNIRKYMDDRNLSLFKKNCGEDILRMLIDCMSGVNDSWYVKWVFIHFIKNKLAVYPTLSKVRNVGYGDSATHCKTIDVLEINYDTQYSKDFKFSVNAKVNDRISKNFLSFFTFRHKLLFRFRLIFKSGGLNLLWKDIKYKYLLH